MTAEAVREVAQVENPFVELDASCQELINGFAGLSDYRALSLPPELCEVKGAYGPKELTLRASAFSARGIALGRIALIRGEGTWIANIVVYPADGYTTPILGIELLVFRERMHLIVADMFPLIEDDESIMDEIAPRYDHVGNDPEMKSWARNIFSQRPIFRKPGDAAMLNVGAQALREVGQVWLQRARQASPETNQIIAVQAAEKRATYIQSHADDEPANPFLKRAFGEEIGGRLVNEILFPTVQWKAVTNDCSNDHRS